MNKDNNSEIVTEEDNLEEEYNSIEPKCSNENLYSKECNTFLLKKEFLERNYFTENSEEMPYLYPNLNDPNFNIKISNKKEFYDTKYDGEIHTNIKEYADSLANADFELQPHQTFVKNFLSFQTPYNSLLLYHGLGTGKCMKKGTPIMLFDGNIELIENIKVGDLLMGDDSTARRVLSLARGRDKMYDIIPSQGDKYTVNQEHILCLYVLNYPKLSYKKNNGFIVRWIENNELKKKNFFVKNDSENEIKNIATIFYEKILTNPLQNNNIIEIAVKDYLNLSIKCKKILKGYKVPVDFPEKPLSIDPYIFGYNLVNNNNAISVPQEYKYNSRINRLKLLAGFLDVSASYNKISNTFEFKQNKLVKLVEDDIVFICRSLGLSCDYKKML